MNSTAFRYAALATLAVTLSLPAAAKGPTPQEVAKMMGDCVYVVNVAELNGVTLEHSSEQWAEWLISYAEANGIDAKKQVDAAKAKYRKRGKVLGADKALSDMIYNARECDKQVAGL